MGVETDKFFRHMADKIATKTDQRYSHVVAFIRRRIRFDLLKTCIISLRGYRGKQNESAERIENLDLHLRPQAT